METDLKKSLFWELAEPLLISGVVEKGTMMGFPCLRVDDKFFASLEKNTNNLIVKLSAQWVSDLIGQGHA